MLDYIVKPIWNADIDDVIANVSDIERQEFELMSGGMPLDRGLMLLNLAESEVANAYYTPDNQFFGIIGWAQVGEHSGRYCIWAIFNDWPDKNPVSFCKITKKIVADLSRVGYRFENYLLKDNVGTIKWLKAIGFTFEDKEYDLHGHKWLHFVMEFSDDG